MLLNQIDKIVIASKFFRFNKIKFQFIENISSIYEMIIILRSFPRHFFSFHFNLKFDDE